MVGRFATMSKAVCSECSRDYRMSCCGFQTVVEVHVLEVACEDRLRPGQCLKQVSGLWRTAAECKRSQVAQVDRESAGLHSVTTVV